MAFDPTVCLEVLRQYDRDRYLACLYLAEPLRGEVSTLYAFDTELSRISSLVSEPAPGEIRMQWWREVVSDDRDHGNHPVAVSLMHVIEKHNLPREILVNLVDARIFDLYQDPMPDMATLEGYAGETASALLQLSAYCAGAEMSPKLADSCGHGGVAQTIAAVLRAIPYHRATRRVYVPSDMLDAVGLDANSWLGGEPDERHLNAMALFVAEGFEHYRQSKNAIDDVEKRLLPLFLPLAPVSAYLGAGRRSGLALFEEPIDISPLLRQWLFFRATLRGLPRA